MMLRRCRDNDITTVMSRRWRHDDDVTTMTSHGRRPAVRLHLSHRLHGAVLRHVRVGVRGDGVARLVAAQRVVGRLLRALVVGDGRIRVVVVNRGERGGGVVGSI